MNKVTIIVAPHADDEIIGCYEVLTSRKDIVVLYGTEAALYEGKSFCIHNDIQCGVISDLDKYDKVDTYYFPDPYFELHPLHRQLGAVGEDLARRGKNVIFYCTNMQAPYIYEVDYPGNKKRLLENTYPRKKSLWQFDHKYFLFEGYTKWIMRHE